MRQAGLLMPISSLPSPFGIGDFGVDAYMFIDLMKQSHCRVWQLLPLNPLGYGNSPYQPYSSVAIDELYISLDRLYKEGLIQKPKSFRAKTSNVDYAAVRQFKTAYYKEAYRNFVNDDSFDVFCKKTWLYPFAVFMALKQDNELRCWNEWPLEQQHWIIDQTYDLSMQEDEIRYQMFLQYILNKQWHALKAYANEQSIQIMGDIPFYVGIDSVDVWANQASFLLDDKSRPTFIAGVPPDYFSTTGQRWGNPIYDWEYLASKNFTFWIERLRYNQEMFDIIRIDHFRAFDTYWKIPVSCPTAEEGNWIEAPGYALFDAVFQELPDIHIVVEDLGDLRKEVLELRDHYGFSGMKIVQFAFDPKETNNDFEDREHLVIYSGTHDNQTIRGWYRSQKRSAQADIRQFFQIQGYSYATIDNFLAYTLDSVANMAILPMQDVLGLADGSRMNTPGTVGSPNWEWKLDKLSRFAKRSAFLGELVKKSNR